MRINGRSCVIALGLLIGSLPPSTVEAQGLSESTGVPQYFSNCASCHEGAESHIAPRTSVLKKMTPELIYEVLTTGSMRTAAASLTDRDKRLIAEWIGGRKIDADSAGAAETFPNRAIDQEKAYFGLVSGAHLALDLTTGEELWYSPIVRPAGRETKRGVVGAVTLIPGVLLSGAGDGVVRAVSSKNGQLLWQFDTAQDFTTVNGVAAHGGSLASGGPTAANGMVFIGSGYPGFQGGDPGNVLLAFAPGVRLDHYADELKKRSGGGGR